MINEKSKSKSQQRLFGMVHAYQKDGTLPDDKELAKKIKDIADGGVKHKTDSGKTKGIDYDKADEFASTKHKGLPNKVKKEEKLREIIRTEILNELNSSQYNRMSGLSNMKALDAFDKACRIIKKDLLEEEFDKKSIESFLWDKVSKIIKGI